mmetsp:Transcript_43587/g.79394  ORF Transcript_43587/g.79394 Transcript_43587/m.79394 type:complete len:463 (+) Transcript_43587:69-1457(+)
MPSRCTICRLTWSRELILVYINAFLYAVCFAVQQPVAPYLVKKLAGEEDAKVVYGRVLSFFSFAQLVGAPFMGFVLDRCGIRIGCIVVYLSSSISFAILGCATKLWILYASKAPAALSHGVLVSQTMIAQLTTPEERAEALALLMSAYTIGATVAPAIGGLIGAKDLYIGAWIAAAGSLVSAGVSLMLPAFPGQGNHSKLLAEEELVRAEDGAAEDLQDYSDEAGRSSKNLGLVDGFKRVAGNHVVLALLFTKLCMTTTNSLYTQARPIILEEKFKVDTKGQGFHMSAMYLCNALSSAFLVGPINRACSTGTFVLGCMTLMTVCFFAMAQSGPATAMVTTSQSIVPGLHASIPHAAISIVASMASFAVSSGMTAITTAQVEDSLKGKLLGLEHGIFSLAAVGVPSLSMILLKEIDIAGMCYTCGGLMVAVMVLWQLTAAPRVMQAEAIRSKGLAEQSEPLRL